MNQTTQGRLLTEYVTSRSEKAFRELVRRNVDHAYSVALHMTRDVEVSHDVVQQVFIRLACDPDIPQKVPIQSWVHTTTRSLAIDVVRNEISRKTRERKYAQSTNMNSTEEVWEELRPVLDDVINRLKPIDRQAVVLRFYHQLSHADIGSELGVTSNAARVRLQRAIERLRLLLAKKGITTTATALSMTLSTHAYSPSPAILATEVSSSALAVATTKGAGSSIVFAKIIAMTELPKLLAAALILIPSVTFVVWQPRGDEATPQIENTPASRNTLLGSRGRSSRQPDAADDPFADNLILSRNDHIERTVALRMAAEEGEYRKLFADFGAPDEKVKLLLQELEEMERAILVAEFAIGDRQKKKNQLEDAVGKEACEEYWNYEMGKPAERDGSSSQPNAADDPFADNLILSRNAHIERMAAEEGEYRKLFEDLGVPNEKVEQLLPELGEMKRTILVAEVAIEDSRDQKKRYQELVEETVGKEAYEEYRKYEMGKPARREIAKFNQFFEGSERGAAMTVEEQSLLAELIQQTGAVTDVDWHGPFSPDPTPARGEEAVKVHFAKLAEDIEIRSDELLSRIEERGGPQSMYDTVGLYYEAQIQNYLSGVEEQPRPIEELHAEIMEMIEQQQLESLRNDH